MEEKLDIPVEILVYGATYPSIQTRPLLQNYYNYTKQDEQKIVKEVFFISEPKRRAHYSIYEDSHGTHIFASNAS